MRDLREQLIIDTAKSGETPFAILGNGEEYRLVSLGDDIDADSVNREMLNGFVYAGVLGVVNGRAKVALDPNAGSREIETARLAGSAFARERIGDSLQWLEHLWALPDTRTRERLDA